MTDYSKFMGDAQAVAGITPAIRASSNWSDNGAIIRRVVSASISATLGAYVSRHNRGDRELEYRIEYARIAIAAGITPLRAILTNVLKRADGEPLYLIGEALLPGEAGEIEKVIGRLEEWEASRSCPCLGCLKIFNATAPGSVPDVTGTAEAQLPEPVRRAIRAIKQELEAEFPEADITVAASRLSPDADGEPTIPEPIRAQAEPLSAREGMTVYAPGTPKLDGLFLTTDEARDLYATIGLYLEDKGGKKPAPPAEPAGPEFMSDEGGGDEPGREDLEPGGLSGEALAGYLEGIPGATPEIIAEAARGLADRIRASRADVTASLSVWTLGEPTKGDIDFNGLRYLPGGSRDRGVWVFASHPLYAEAVAGPGVETGGPAKSAGTFLASDYVIGTPFPTPSPEPEDLEPADGPGEAQGPLTPAQARAMFSAIDETRAAREFGKGRAQAEPEDLEGGDGDGPEPRGFCTGCGADFPLADLERAACRGCRDAEARGLPGPA